MVRMRARYDLIFCPDYRAIGLAGILAALFFGNARARLCALLLTLVVALGDPLVVNTIKHAVHRMRPCLALPGVIDTDDIYFDAALKRIYMPGGAGYIYVYQMKDPDHYSLLARIPTAIGGQ